MATRSGPVDVIVAGMAVVDVIGRPVNLRKMPKPGSLSVIESVTLTSGGNVANVGIDLAKLGFRVGAIARVGTDELGAFVVGKLRDHGIDPQGVVADRRKQTPATIVVVSRNGERTFLHTRGCIERFSANDVLRHLSLITRARIFAFGYLGLLPEMEHQMPSLFQTIKKRTKALISLDTGGNPSYRPALLRRMLPFVDFFIPSYDEAVILTREKTPGRIVRSLRSSGASGVVGVKLGSKGCYISSNGREMLIPPVRVRKVVDATGAGDAFIAGFLGGTLAGKDPFAAAAIGNRVAADCVSAVGASTRIRALRSLQ
jgi:sugar/nucleoside kinase (ribokinase family)